MAFLPISGIVPQATENGNQADGMVLKFYEPGTLTPLAVGIDSTGVTQTTEFVLSTEGYTTLTGNEEIPHVDQIYKIVLYLDQADADANKTASAVYEIDDIDVGRFTEVAPPNDVNYNNVALALASLLGVPGDFITTSEYNAGTSAGGGRYKIVAADPGFNLINPIKSDGNYLELILEGDLFIENAGAFDGKTDSTAEIQECINSQSINFGNKVRAGKGTFNFTSIYFYFDAANNPEFSQLANADGQIWFDGAGYSSRTLFPSALRGTTINCTLSSGLGVNLGKEATFSRAVRLSNMNITGNINGTLVYQSTTALGSALEGLLIVNENELSTSVGLYTNRVWGSTWKNIEVYGVTNTNAGTGIHYDVLNAADGGGSGGMNLFENITCDRFEKGAVFGRVYDGGQLLEGDFSKNVYLLNVQCRRGIEGLTVQHGIRGMTIKNCWFEANDTCHIRLRDSCEQIHIEGGIFSLATEGLICEGISGGTDVQNTVKGVTVVNPDFAFLDVAGYRRYGTDDSGRTVLTGVRAQNNGGTIVVADNRYQRIDLDVSEWNGNINRTIRDETDTNAPQLINHGDVNGREVIVAAETTVDYSTWLSVPGFLRCSSTGGGDIGVVLPTPGAGSDFDSNISMYDIITIQKDSTFNNVNITGGFTATLTADQETLTLKGTAGGWRQVYS